MAAQPHYMQPTSNARRRKDQDTASQTPSRTSQSQISRSETGSGTPNTIYFGPSTRAPDPYQAALEPHGIEIHSHGYSENVRKHFRVDGKAAHIPDRVASLEPEHREALRGVTIWLDPNDDDFAHFVETEYTSMVTSSMKRPVHPP